MKQKKVFLVRALFSCLGLAVMAFGIGFSIKANLGTSPISSFPYVLSLITPLSVGMATLAMHVVFIAIQMVLLRRDYRMKDLMQLPTAFLFGFLTDGALYVIDGVSAGSYAGQWGLCLMGIVLVGVGVSIEVSTNVCMLAGEGVILAVCRTFPIKFGNMKTAFDVTLVVTAVVTGLCFLGRVEGVREGTVAAALCVGVIARNMNRIIKKFTKFLRVKRALKRRREKIHCRFVG